jgi:hypothetical protein
MLNKWSIFIAFVFFLSIVLDAQTLFLRRVNRYNKHKERTGIWITYNDSAKKIRSSKVRYKNDNAIGRGYYYNAEGILARREIVRFKRIKTILYNPNCKVRARGNAKIENYSDRLHYFFYGRWKYYDDNGKLVKYVFYERGVNKKTIYLDKNNLSYDSLINALNTFEKRFKERNLELINVIDNSKNDQKKIEKYRQQLFNQDSALFIEVGKYLDISGYPATRVAGESANIPFYIFCYAPWDKKEKYLPIFKKAVAAGDLSAKTLAYYIDKLLLAKGEKQIYGTQFYFDKNNNLITYPSIEPDSLLKRREEVGL